MMFAIAIINNAYKKLFIIICRSDLDNWSYTIVANELKSISFSLQRLHAAVFQDKLNSSVVKEKN